MISEADIRLTTNRQAAGRNEPYGSRRASLLAPAGFATARAEIEAWPGYRPSPLLSLPAQAAALGIGEIRYKDESVRFGLKSFKALGGAYAVARVLSKELARQGIADHATSQDLASGRYSDATAGITITSATDGNHGRSVAWGAKLFGCKCTIFIHQTVSEGRRAAIADYGAEVVRLSGGYDDAVRHAFAEGESNGWFVVQDTGTPSYVEVPADITYGYGLIAAEVMDQMAEPPTHVLAQAGVGGLASALCAQFWIGWGERRPKFVILEPVTADCVCQSLAAGQPTVVTGDLETVMAGLSCGEVSTLAWTVLSTGADAGLAIADHLAFEGMRRLANPLADDREIVAGECSGGALGALVALHQRPDLRHQLGLEGTSRVLLIGTEGDTDPEIYTRVVGRPAKAV